MKFKLMKASDCYSKPPEEIEINSLDDLKKLQEHYISCSCADELWMERCSLVVDFVDMIITIYDYWME